MVSRPGIFTPEDCYGEYTTDKDVFDNAQAWDLIPMDATQLALQDTLATVVACQEACSASDNCQYMAFYRTGAPDGDGNNKCYFRLAGAIAPVTADNWDAPSQALVAFEIREGQYVVYKATDAEQIGVPLTTTPVGLFDAKAACEKNRECVGMKGTSAGWTLFGAIQREDAIGKIRVVGENIQSWVPLPTGL